MRHYLLSGPVATLAFGVGATTAKAALVATTGSTHGLAASLIGTWRGAVAIATITVAADKRGGVTADEASVAVDSPLAGIANGSPRTTLPLRRLSHRRAYLQPL